MLSGSVATITRQAAAQKVSAHRRPMVPGMSGPKVGVTASRCSYMAGLVDVEEDQDVLGAFVRFPHVLAARSAVFWLRGGDPGEFFA